MGKYISADIVYKDLGPNTTMFRLLVPLIFMIEVV